MVADTERNYTGTNFVVIALAVLLILVVSFYVVAQVRDVADDGVGYSQRAATFR